jgi:hypothetical protein
MDFTASQASRVPDRGGAVAAGRAGTQRIQNEHHRRTADHGEHPTVMTSSTRLCPRLSEIHEPIRPV